MIQRIRQHEVPPGFHFVVEGPMRSLDGEYFDVTTCTPATRELMHRLAMIATELGAEGVVMHCIAPRLTLTDDDWESREGNLEGCLDFVQFYVDTLLPLGLIPTLENVPPVLRMREGRYLFTPVGMAPEDIRWFLDHVPGLQTTLDVSHGQLYVNAWRMAQQGKGDADVQPLMRHLQHYAPIESVETFIDVNGASTFEAHVSNATGLLGEGAPYSEGDIDMQRVVERLAKTARFLVTETLEPDNDHAGFMRQAQEGIASVLQSLREARA